MSEQGQGDPLDARDLESLATAAADDRGVTKKRVQRWISYMVLVSQLEQVSRDPEGPSFTLKGGVPLEMRLDGQARATRDLDLIVHVGGADEMVPALRTGLDGSYQGFTFRVKGDEYRMDDSIRVSVALEYRGRGWNTIQIDLSPKEGHKLEEERLEPLDLARFRIDLIDEVSCLSLRYHLAHKIHGMTLPSTEEDPNERAHDLVDVFLIRERLDSGSRERVREACLDVFRARDQHDWPPAFDPPEFWRAEFETRAADLGLSVATFDDAVEEARRYITALEEAG